jgi:pyridoxine 5-phosphate synthase
MSSREPANLTIPENTMTVHLFNSVDQQRFCLQQDLLRKRTEQLLALLDKRDRPLSIVLMDDTAMAGYNQQYRGKEGPTNVLSFPADDLQADLPPELTGDQLGDILISVETALREAAEKQCSLHHRITELIIHGTLHLLGYDHEVSTRQALVMWEKEQTLIQQIIRSGRRNMPHLAINVDHVATVRQARGGIEPDPVHAAGICELAGAEGIVVHLREDRRHIQDRDVQLLRQTVKTRLNLEMAAAKEIIDIALDIKPDMITLVPEKRQELTTEGGLDVVGNVKKLKKTITKMRKAGIPVSIFIDPDAVQIEASQEIGATFVELHTGRYCDAVTEEERDREFRLIEQSAELAFESGLRVNAGHGLDYRTTTRIAALPTIEELSIGHAVITRAVFVGLDQAVREMRDCILLAGG